MRFDVGAVADVRLDVGIDREERETARGGVAARGGGAAMTRA
jgi:hypothetical protein